MAKGKKTGGRKAGIPNKVTRAAQEAVDLAFQGLGGVTALTEWAQNNPGEFYCRLYARRIPNATELSGPDGEALKVGILVPALDKE